MNGYKIVLLKAILCFIGCRKVNGYAPEYVLKKCADIMRMAFVDHLIITRDKECYYSFSDNGQI